jgi:hypothetical protein
MLLLSPAMRSIYRLYIGCCAPWRGCPRYESGMPVTVNWAAHGKMVMN